MLPDNASPSSDASVSPLPHSERYRYAFIVEYNGQNFCGWQYQPGLCSVQGALEEACSLFVGERPSFFGAGRTDTGVHALGQVAHADFSRQWPEYKLRRGINTFLRMKGHEVSILHVTQVPLDFHARFSAVMRHYLYRILCRPSPTVLDSQRVWWSYRPFSLQRMQEAAQLFLGTHDFSHFRCIHCSSKRPIKTIESFSVTSCADEIHIRVSARSFLHKQVRMMVGALAHVGWGLWPLSAISERLTSCPLQPKKLLLTAPAHGLYFTSVDYPISLTLPTLEKL